MDDKKRILEMIENGQITAEEGLELLNALNSCEEEKNNVAPYASPKKNYKFLKIRVTSENGTVNVNVNIPIKLLMVLGGLAGKMTNMIPKEARQEMENKGIDISSIDFVQIIEEILSGTIEDSSIIDVESWDEEHKDMVKVKIYVE